MAGIGADKPRRPRPAGTPPAAARRPRVRRVVGVKLPAATLGKPPTKTSAKPVPQPQAERREQAIRRHLDAALQMVAEKGSIRFTLAEVGEAAGYSRGLAAHYFGNKSGLLRALSEHVHIRFIEQMRLVPASRPGLEALLNVVSVYLSDADTHPAAYRALQVMLTEALVSGSSLRDGMVMVTHLAMRLLEQQIRIGIERGEIRAGLDPAAQAVLILGSLHGVGNLRLMHPKPIGLAAIRDQMVASLRRSLAA